jgi:hypothetical protein
MGVYMDNVFRQLAELRKLVVVKNEYCLLPKMIHYHVKLA